MSSDDREEGEERKSGRGDGADGDEERWDGMGREGKG